MFWYGESTRSVSAATWSQGSAAAPERRPMIAAGFVFRTKRRGESRSRSVRGRRFAGNPCSGPRLGPGPGCVDQAWCKAGGSAPEQSRRRRLDLFRILDAVHRRRPHRGDRCAGLDHFAADGQDTIVLSMVTGHGRATPLLWKTVASSTLKGNQRRYEYEVLCRLREVLPAGVKVTVVADRGFADCKLFYALTTELAFEYVIRLRGDIYVTNARGERRAAAAWVGVGGHARRLVGARVTDAYELPVGVVVCVQDPKMDEPWCLVASEATVPTRVLIRYYGKRWGIEAGYCPIHGPFCPRVRLSSAHFGGTATKPARTRVFPAASRASKRCRTPSVCPPLRRAPFWTFARRSGTVPWEGRQACDGCDDRIPGTYIRRAANRRPLHRSPEPGPVCSGRCCLRGCQSLPLVQRSPADERERTRTGTAPAAPGFGTQAPARTSRPTQPERGCWSGRGHRRCRVLGAARARKPRRNDLRHDAGCGSGLRAARSRRLASARCRAEPAAGALLGRDAPPRDHRDRLAGTTAYALEATMVLDIIHVAAATRRAVLVVGSSKGLSAFGPRPDGSRPAHGDTWLQLRRFSAAAGSRSLDAY